MAVVNGDLKFYLTGSEPAVTQTVASQSLGGYISTTEVSPSALLSNNLGVASTSLITSTSLVSPTNLAIADEIMASSGTGTTLTVTRSQYQTAVRFHIAGDVVYNISQQKLFNASFNASGKQYRCIAIKNTHATDIFYDLKLYIKENSRNPSCSFRLAVEVPKYDILEGTGTGGSTISLVDSSLIGLDEEEFVNTVLRFTSGVNTNLTRQIASFDTVTGTFTFLTAVPTAITTGTAYRVEDSPAQRLSSGLIAPTVNTTYVSDWGSGPTSINIGSRISGANLWPNEVIYVWFERTLAPNAEAVLNNRVIFTAQYKTS